MSAPSAARLVNAAKAISACDIVRLEMLVRTFPDLVNANLPSTWDLDGVPYVPFSVACLDAKFYDGFDLAVRHGFNVNAKVGSVTASGMCIEPGTLLSRTLTSPYPEAVEFLLSRGADPAQLDSEGNSALCAAWVALTKRVGDASLDDSFEVMNVLLDHNVPWVSTCKSRAAPVPTIAMTGFGNEKHGKAAIAVLEKGIQKGWDPNAQNRIETPSGSLVRIYNGLEATLVGGGKPLMLALIRLGSDVKALPNGRTLLDLLNQAPEPHWNHMKYREWIPDVAAEVMRLQLNALTVVDQPRRATRKASVL